MPKNLTQSDIDNKFLDQWRKLEQALKDQAGMMVSGLENNLKAQSRAEDASKLCICRQIRNFMVHDSKGFACASEAMIEFVSGLTYEIERVKGTVKDHMATAVKYGAMNIGERVDNAAALVLAKKHGDILVLNDDKSLAGVMGAKALAMALSDHAGGSSIRWLAENNALAMPARTIKPDTPMDKAPGMSEKAVVIDDKNKCVGVLNPEGAW